MYSLRLCIANGVCGFDGANPNRNILKSPSFKKNVKTNPKFLFYPMAYFTS